MTRVVPPFRFAIQAVDFADAAGVSAHAREIESLGYDEMFSYDHTGTVDPFTPLMVAAGVTTRLRFGPLVLNNEFHHPALLARTAASVDLLTGGRLVLGLGTGYMQSEHDAIGLQLRAPGPRVARFEESIIVLRALLDTGACTFNGAHHTIAVDDLGVRPAQAHVPLLLGGHGRRVVAIAARHADIFQFTGLTHGEGGVPAPGGFGIDDVVERSRWLTDAAGARNDTIERSVLVQATYVGDGAGKRLAVMAERFRLDVDVLAATPFVLVGSLQQVIDKLERLRELLGVSHVVVRDTEGFAPVVAELSGH